jgi:hypothetical protein
VQHQLLTDSNVKARQGAAFQSCPVNSQVGSLSVSSFASNLVSRSGQAALLRPNFQAHRAVGVASRRSLIRTAGVGVTRLAAKALSGLPRTSRTVLRAVVYSAKVLILSPLVVLSAVLTEVLGLLWYVKRTVLILACAGLLVGGGVGTVQAAHWLNSNANPIHRIVENNVPQIQAGLQALHETTAGGTS